jgi:hypothetical protein
MTVDLSEWPYNFKIPIDQYLANEMNYLRALDEHFGENNNYPYKWTVCWHRAENSEEQHSAMFLFRYEKDAVMARLLWK